MPQDRLFINQIVLIILRPDHRRSQHRLKDGGPVQPANEVLGFIPFITAAVMFILSDGEPDLPAIPAPCSRTELPSSSNLGRGRRWWIRPGDGCRRR